MRGQYTRKSASERFWSKVLKTDTCWLWTGHTRHGYGYFAVEQRREVRAHRYAYETIVGPIGEGQQVNHHCDVKHCVRPDHLYIGTQADNIRDKVVRERVARGDRHGLRVHPERRARGDDNGARTHPERRARGEQHGSKLHPERLARGERNGANVHRERMARGERHGNAKLTSEIVHEIRRKYAQGNISYRALGREYGVTHRTIQLIVANKAWIE